MVKPTESMISIHKALAGLDGQPHQRRLNYDISIHKALAGLDVVAAIEKDDSFYISIHMALAGLDTNKRTISVFCSVISIHKALAGLDGQYDGKYYASLISIHKALAGLDLEMPLTANLRHIFQSTRPSRASTSQESHQN